MSRIITLDSSLPLDQQQWLGLNSPELTGPWAKSGGAVYRSDGLLRWGRVDDAFLFRITHNDPPLADNTRRCEVVAYAEAGTSLPVDKDFWYSFRFRMPVGASASDAVSLTQWHQQGGAPLMALILQSGVLTLTVRHGTGSSSQTHHIWQSAATINDWTTIILHARIAQPLGLIRAWCNGQLVTQYAGPLGNNARPTPYAKCGLYWWPDRNAWDVQYPDRVLLVSRASITADVWSEANA